jgi:ATP-dependent RNA helicase DDX3X
LDFDKKQRLMDLLLEQPPARTLVFVKSKRACDSLDDYLYNLKFPCTSIHGDRTQREREVRPILVRSDSRMPWSLSVTVKRPF